MTALENSLLDFTFILMRPQYLGNIGSVARVLKNFGFKSLRLVAPPKNYKDAEARKMAVGAFDVLKNSQVYDSLNDALSDVSVAIGTSCAKQRDICPISVEQLIPKLNAMAGNKIAFIFGDERDGLRRDELERCHHIAMVPTASDFPSLNVSQAVGIFAYELAKLTVGERQTEALLPTGREDDELFNHIEGLLDEVGFTRAYNRNNISAELRSLYQRLQPTARELDLLRGALRKIDQKLRALPPES